LELEMKIITRAIDTKLPDQSHRRLRRTDSIASNPFMRPPRTQALRLVDKIGEAIPEDSE